MWSRLSASIRVIRGKNHRRTWPVPSHLWLCMMSARRLAQDLLQENYNYFLDQPFLPVIY
jgi:hypothetical protein